MTTDRSAAVEAAFPVTEAPITAEDIAQAVTAIRWLWRYVDDGTIDYSTLNPLQLREISAELGSIDATAARAIGHLATAVSEQIPQAEQAIVRLRSSATGHATAGDELSRASSAIRAARLELKQTEELSEELI
ncbi:hypothetical protein [Nocardia sp. CDC160]|uniref:hypothetical protein n=1 Tax=Nocardia sp. CDC160 TaxID=3112166 RepID=UPI002DBA1DE9|nr:hypothetical protein [Nocardia sp. CDC160]MEC3920286.1 hypothetical protein [Nocardia sp. CDC160]